MANSETLNTLFKKYGLTFDKDNPTSKDNDVFMHKHYKIITRAGIQKIEKAAGIWMDITPVGRLCSIENVKTRDTEGNEVINTITNITMRGEGYAEGMQRPYITYASASSENSTNKYFAEMAEKRVRSRMVLTLAGLYQLGVYGVDEADDFKKVMKEAQRESDSTINLNTNSTNPIKATYKGA